MATHVQENREVQTGIVRFKRGTDLRKIPNLAYMIQLMACLEANHSALRWLGYTENEPKEDTVRSWDRFTALTAGMACCAEAFPLLKEGRDKGLINEGMLGGKPNLLSLWKRIENPDELIGKVHRIRDKYFAHFDQKIIEKFISWQIEEGAGEPFFVGDEDGRPLESRYLWPLAAAFFDLHPHPDDPERQAKCDKMQDELNDIWAQTGNLITQILESWLSSNEHNFEVVNTNRT